MQGLGSYIASLRDGGTDPCASPLQYGKLHGQTEGLSAQHATTAAALSAQHANTAALACCFPSKVAHSSFYPVHIWCLLLPFTKSVHATAIEIQTLHRVARWKNVVKACISESESTAVALRDEIAEIQLQVHLHRCSSISKSRAIATVTVKAAVIVTAAERQQQQSNSNNNSEQLCVAPELSRWLCSDCFKGKCWCGSKNEECWASFDES